MLHCFNFANFSKPSYAMSEVPEPFEPEPASDRPLEEPAGAQALGVDLKEAVMACLSGGESRRWTIGELVERFKNLGISASRASVTAALAELELELELAPWAPWRLVERGTEWILAPKSELMELLLSARKLPLKSKLSEEHKAVLLVVIGHRRKGGVSKTRIAEILALDPSPFLDDLLRQELVYADPAREINFWRPTRGALLALGLRSNADIPALKELEDWFESLASKSAAASAPHAELDSYFARTKNRWSRRLKRDLERRQSVTSLPGTQGTTAAQESSPDLLRGELDTPLPHPGKPPESIVEGRPAQGSATRSGEKEI
jgi:chromosome segregation and condensation protein ScpB